MKPVKEIVLQYARVADERDALREQVNTLRGACQEAKDLLEYHEGSARVQPGQYPVIWVNGVDWQTLLEIVRAALKETEPK